MTRVVIGAAAELREWVAQTLKGHRDFEVVFETDSSLECLAAVSRMGPEIVILGSELRKLDVVETVETLKKERQTPKCLVLTQYVSLVDRMALAGADCCLTLPCTGKALLRRLEELAPVLT